LYPRFNFFNPIQTQLFHTLYHTDRNVLIGAPTGSGKTIMCELAILKLFASSVEGSCVYIAPLKSLARERLIDWVPRFEKMKRSVVELTGDFTPDI
jgi:activating signal cointegrator complex subunit 3